MIYAFVSLSAVVVLGGVALRALILGVSEHLEGDDIRPASHS